MKWLLVTYWICTALFSVFAFLALMCIYLVLNVPGLLFAAGMYGAMAMNGLYNAGREFLDYTVNIGDKTDGI